MEPLEKQREKKKNMIIWGVFIGCATFFTVVLLSAINKTYSNAGELNTQSIQTKETYKELFGEELR